MKHIGIVLKTWMSQQGLKTAQLAQKAGMKQPTVHRILAGDVKDPRRSSIEKIARALGYTAEEAYQAASSGENKQSSDRLQAGANSAATAFADAFDGLSDSQVEMVLNLIAELQASKR